ncbi:MAG: type VI secretion system contractile sheath large subunit [Polyangiaceae bacterium]
MRSEEGAKVREYLWSNHREYREYGGELLAYYEDLAIARGALDGVLAFVPSPTDPTAFKLQVTGHPVGYLCTAGVQWALRLIERPERVRSLDFSGDGDNPSFRSLALPRLPALERLRLSALPIVSLLGLRHAPNLVELEITRCDDLEGLPGIERALALRRLVVVHNLARLTGRLPPNLEEVVLQASDPWIYRRDVRQPITPDPSVRLPGNAKLRSVVLRGPLELADLSGCPSLEDVDVRACLRLECLQLTGARLCRFAPRIVARPQVQLTFREALSIPPEGGDGFAPFEALRELDLGGATSLVDLDGIENLRALERLSLRDARRVTDLTPLERLPALRTVEPAAAPPAARAVPTEAEALETLREALRGGSPLVELALADVDRALAEIDARVSRQLDPILRHPTVRALTVAWRALRVVVEEADPLENVKVEVLNVSLADLVDDFEDSPPPHKPGLYKLVFQAEYHWAGAKPFGLIVANYDLHLGSRELAVLKDCARIAQHAHAVFVTSVAPDALAPPAREATLAAVAELRRELAVRNVSLVLGRMQWRDRFSHEAERDLEGPATPAMALRYLACTPFGWAVPIEGPLPALRRYGDVVGASRDEAAALAPLGFCAVTSTPRGDELGGFDVREDLAAMFAVTRILQTLRAAERQIGSTSNDQVVLVLQAVLDGFVRANAALLRAATIRLIESGPRTLRCEVEIALAWRAKPVIEQVLYDRE